jgi:hypothetical protein
MAIPNETNRVSYVGNGGTGPFTIPFYFLEEDDLLVIRETIADGTETLFTVNVDYVVTGAGVESGGELTLLAGMTNSYNIHIIRDPDRLQQILYPSNDKFPSKTHEQGLDKLTMLVQRLIDKVNRSVKAPETAPGDLSYSATAWKNRASKLQGFDAGGSPSLVTLSTPGALVVSAFIETLLDDANAAAARTTLDVPSNAQAVLASLIAAKGDIFVGTANDTVAIRSVGQDSQMLMPNSSTADGWSFMPAALGNAVLISGKLHADVSGNALTVSVKTSAGADPSQASPVWVLCRDLTSNEGALSYINIQNALSLTVSSGSTLGTTSTIPHRLWVVLFNDNSVPRLGIVNLLGKYDLIGDDVFGSSTAEGGAGAADSANVIYSGAAVSGRPMRVIGYIDSTQTVAGTWAAAPTKVGTYAPAMASPPIPQVWNLIETVTASNAATVDFTREINATYDAYKIVATDLRPQTDDTFLYARVSEDGGSTFKSGASDYRWARSSINQSGDPPTTGVNGDVADAQMSLIQLSNDGTKSHAHMELHFYIPSDTTRSKAFEGTAVQWYEISAAVHTFKTFIMGYYIGANAINAVRLLMSSGNINGKFSLYGMRR